MNAIACVNVHACKMTFHHSRIWLRLGEEGRGAARYGTEGFELIWMGSETTAVAISAVIVTAINTSSLPTGKLHPCDHSVSLSI